jgi:hypothetical protein
MLERLNYEGRPVRTHLDEGGEPWFCVADVGAVLGMKNHKDFLKSEYCDGDGVESFSLTDDLGRTQEASFINESNLYAMVLRSSKPEAKAFRKWITGEVLPSIRRHGTYPPPSAIQAPMQAGFPQPPVENFTPDPMVAAFEGMIALRRHQLVQEERLSETERRLQAIEARQEQAQEAVMALPAPEVPLEDLEADKKCRQACSMVMQATGLSAETVWRSAYREYSLRLGVNLTARVDRYNSGKRPKDQLSKLQWICKWGEPKSLYAILSDMAKRSIPA